MAMRVSGTFMVCTDCCHFIANGDMSHFDGVYTAEKASERMAEVESAVAELGPHACLGDYDNDENFSWASCECCGSSLGGSRHEVVTLVDASAPCVHCGATWLEHRDSDERCADRSEELDPHRNHWLTTTFELKEDEP